MQEQIIHPNFDENFVDNDVALLRFSTNDDDNVFGDTKFSSADKRRTKNRQGGKFKSTASYTPVCLPKQGQELPAPSKDTKCMIMGWGKSKESDVFGSDVLREAEVRKKPI